MPDASSTTRQKQLKPIVIKNAFYTRCGTTRLDKPPTVNWCTVLFLTYSSALTQMKNGFSTFALLCPVVCRVQAVVSGGDMVKRKENMMMHKYLALGFSGTMMGNEERQQYVVCLKILASSDSMKPNKLRCRFEALHHECKEKPVEVDKLYYFNKYIWNKSYSILL